MNAPAPACRAALLQAVVVNGTRQAISHDRMDLLLQCSMAKDGCGPTTITCKASSPNATIGA
jgi:hypothetical protein